jgi:ankyrin repeat protein
VTLMQAVSAGRRQEADGHLDRRPELALARIERAEELFLAECHAQVYAGDTALHAAAFAYDAALARKLVALGADIHARNRRGAQPLHAAMVGSPGSDHWDPERQRAVIECLVELGADPDGRAAGGVTPLHRAVRNRCSAAVQALLRAGADPRAANDHGSTASDLARWTTGRGGSGSAEAQAEQRMIIQLLETGAD